MPSRRRTPIELIVAYLYCPRRKPSAQNGLFSRKYSVIPENMVKQTLIFNNSSKYKQLIIINFHSLLQFVTKIQMISWNLGPSRLSKKVQQQQSQRRDASTTSDGCTVAEEHELHAVHSAACRTTTTEMFLSGSFCAKMHRRLQRLAHADRQTHTRTHSDKTSSQDPERTSKRTNVVSRRRRLRRQS